jgi:hypothetical protein
MDLIGCGSAAATEPPALTAQGYRRFPSGSHDQSIHAMHCTANGAGRD